MTKRIPVLAAAVLAVVLAAPAAAQTGDLTVSGGLARASTEVEVSGIGEVGASATGFFAEGRVAHAVGVGGYFGMFRALNSTSGQVGGLFSPLRPDWIARPQGRAGLTFGSGGSSFTFGGGVDVGRDFGGTLAIDMRRRSESSPFGAGWETLFKFGGYYRLPF